MIRLEVVEGASPGRVYELTSDVAFVGRAPQNEAVLDDGHVSGRHLRIVRGLDGVATIEDLGSTNGTVVIRGEERRALTEPGDAMELLDGDVLELGRDDERCRLAVAIEDDEGSAHLVSVKSVGAEAELPDDPVTLRRVYEAQRTIGRARDLDAVLEAVAQSVFDLVTHATHVTVVLQAADATSGKAGEVKVTSFLPVLTRVRPGHASPGEDGAQPFIPITRSVYRKVLKERSAVLAADAPKEVAATPSMMGASVRSCVAVPLWEGEEILGVLQVDNRDAPGMLKGPDLDVLLCVAEQASLAVANGRLIKRLVVAEEKARREATFLKGREEERRGGRELNIIGDSEPMKELLSQLDKVADTNVTVLIEGETGTGKELVASALHYRSRRRDELFVAQNCAAIAETLLESELFGHVKGAFTGASDDKKGLFELADGSTLFLDEITEAPMSIQSKLLRVLQEGEIRPVGAAQTKHVNVRVVAATNRRLEDEVQAGRFREDLYYRLKVFPLRVPPLKERRGDIPLLVQHFLERYALEIGKPVAGLSAEAEHVLVAYDWPGNVRELQNEVQRVVIQVDPGGFVTPDLLSSRMRRGEELVERAGASRGKLKETLVEVEKYLVYEALRAHGNNKTNTAKSLGITREGLHKKLRQYES